MINRRSLLGVGSAFLLANPADAQRSQSQTPPTLGQALAADADRAAAEAEAAAANAALMRRFRPVIGRTFNLMDIPENAEGKKFYVEPKERPAESARPAIIAQAAARRRPAIHAQDAVPAKAYQIICPVFFATAAEMAPEKPAPTDAFYIIAQTDKIVVGPRYLITAPENRQTDIRGAANAMGEWARGKVEGNLAAEALLDRIFPPVQPQPAAAPTAAAPIPGNGPS